MNTEEKKEIPPVLVFPIPRTRKQAEEKKVTEGLKPTSDKPIAIRYVTGKDVQALMSNLLTAFIIFVVMFAVIRLKTDRTLLTVGIPLAVIWILILIFGHRLGVSVKGREADLFLDNITNELIVYLKGFHFTAWFSSKESDQINFQRHAIKKASEQDNSCLILTTQDGYEIQASLEMLVSLRNSAEALSHSLNFKFEDMVDWLWALTVASLSDLAACNSYASLLYYKVDAARWLADLFGGEGHISLIEEATGTEVKNPILTALNPTTKSRELFAIQARNEAIANGYRALVAAKISPAEAEIIAQTSAGAATREIRTYQGLPTSAQVIAFGDSGLAVAAGKNQNPKGNEKKGH